MSLALPLQPSHTAPPSLFKTALQLKQGYKIMLYLLPINYVLKGEQTETKNKERKNKEKKK